MKVFTTCVVSLFITAVCLIFLLKLKWPKNKSVHDLVYERYGHETLKVVRDYEKDLSRYNKISLDIGFLQKCKLFHVFPKFLNFKLSRQEFHGTRACRRFKEDLLSYELKQKCSARRNYKESYESARSRLKVILSPLDFSHICSTIEAKASKFKDRISNKPDKKFNNLKRKYGIPQLSNLNSDDIIFIYSHHVLSEVEKKVLARGLRFCLPPKEVDTYEVKCSFELLFRDLTRFGPVLSSETKDRLRSQLKNISNSYIYAYDFSKQGRILSKEEWTALADLRNDDSIIITKPDKGNGIIIVNKLDYLSKMKQLISDETNLKNLRKTQRSLERTVLLPISVNLKEMVLLMMKHFVKYCHLVPRMVSSMVFPRYINLVVRFALLSPLLTLITITLRPVLFRYFNLSQLTSLLSRTPSSLQNGPRHTIIMANICAHLMLVHSSPMFHLMKQYKSV